MSRFLEFIFHNVRHKLMFIMKDGSIIKYNPAVNRINADNESVQITTKGRRTDKVLYNIEYIDVDQIISTV